MDELISDGEEITVKTKDLADSFCIAESTVRKYAQALEAQGIIFRKDKTGGRLFKKEDFDLFTLLTRARDELKMGLGAAADFAATQYRANKYDVSPTQSVQPLPDKESIELISRYELEQIIQKAARELAATMVTNDQVKELKKHNEQLDSEIKIIKEKLDIAVDFIQKMEDKSEKKGFLKRIFGK